MNITINVKDRHDCTDVWQIISCNELNEH